MTRVDLDAVGQLRQPAQRMEEPLRAGAGLDREVRGRIGPEVDPILRSPSKKKPCAPAAVDAISKRNGTSASFATMTASHKPSTDRVASIACAGD